MAASDLIDRARAFLFGRKRPYQTTFLNVTGEQVLADLAKFCRAHDTTFHPDANVAHRLDGRREVWLRIQQHLNLTDEQIWQLYNGNKQ